MQRTIILVDDDELLRDRLARAFRERGFEVFAASGCDEALGIIRKHQPDMAVIDLRMPGRSGLELIREVGRFNPGMRVVMLTGYGSIATATEAIRLGALDYLTKPAEADDILKAFSRDGASGISSDQFDPKTPTLARVEWEHINRVLADCGGNISAAAKKLGLHRRTLQRKLYKYAPPE